jgi:hypothetical protein
LGLVKQSSYKAMCNKAKKTHTIQICIGDVESLDTCCKIIIPPLTKRCADNAMIGCGGATCAIVPSGAIVRIILSLVTLDNAEISV